VDRYTGRSTVDSRPGQGGTLAGAWRAAATEGRSSRRKHLEKEGTEGNRTAILVGVGAVRFCQATVDQGGDRSFSMGQRLEHGEWELGAGLDAVERSQEANKDLPSLNEAAPPTQEDDQDQEGEQDKDGDQDHEMGNNQWGVEKGEDENDQEKSRSSPFSHPRVRQTIQRDHSINNILDAIEKRVITRSHVAIFCEHYSFVFSFEPFKVKDALQDPNWMVAMQEKLNNFKRNQVWSLVERPKQNVVGTK
jgi:hypothetical protein